ncbi:MAG: enoyl-CoA hydratase/isomerase family protein [Nevskiales bacterium]
MAVLASRSAPPLPAALAQVSEWSLGSTAEFSPLSAQRYLLFEAGSAETLNQEETERIVAWLGQLPCPTIAIAHDGVDDAVTAACDVVLDDPGHAAPLLANIEHCPIAASVLVQLLRTTASLPMLDALTVESLAYATLQGGAEFQRWLAQNKAASPAQPTDDGPPVVVTRDDDELRLELNRPSNRNAINLEMRDALVEALQLVIADSSIRSVKASGRGKCFSVGGDLTEFGTLPNPAMAHVIRGLTMPGRFLAQCAERVEFHVHGACIGSGVELPAFGRCVTAAADSFFHLPELRFGLIPGGGGCVGIPRRIGRQRTAWLVLSGKRINAKQALEWGLVDAIV